MQLLLLCVLVGLEDWVSESATDCDESADDCTDAKSPEWDLRLHNFSCDERGKAGSYAKSQNAERLKVLLALFVAARLLDYQRVDSRVEECLSDRI